MTFALHLLKLVYFMLPAYLANMAPVFAKVILSRRAMSPIDFGTKVGGHPIFGKHKTIGGFLFGIIIGLATAYIQFLLYPYLKNICFVDYSMFWMRIGFLMGCGSVTGDLVESFLKRRLNIKVGKPWFPFDELDFAIGALIFISPFYFPGWIDTILILLISALGHMFVVWVGYRLKIRKKEEIVDIGGGINNLLKKIKRYFHVQAR